ncbi:MAG TPA: hypothetical protein VLL05_21240 [Terriglobales bacterium]|nr:hypothetical protein [Terriglobales bacterium]
MLTTFPHSVFRARAGDGGKTITAKTRQCAGQRILAKKQTGNCTKKCHQPVSGLHSIDFAGHKIVLFSLTLKIEGVEITSFFDTF